MTDAADLIRQYLRNSPDTRIDDDVAADVMADVSEAVGYDATTAVRSKVSEEEMQRDLFTWIRGQQGAVPELRWAFHVPNGGHRLAVVGAKMRRAGVRRGIPDVLMPVPRREYCGMALELKTGRNTCTPEQKEWLVHLESNPWAVYVVYNDWQLAANELLRYLGRDELLFDVEVESGKV